MAEQNKQNYDIAFAHIRNNQNISAYNHFINLANAQKEVSSVKAGLLYILAGECKLRQGKNNRQEVLEAGKLFLDFGKKENSYRSRGAYLLASKCFLKAGKYDDAKKAYRKSKELPTPVTGTVRPVIIVDDSKAVTVKLQNYLQKLGYSDTYSFETGKDAIKGCKKLIQDTKAPIVLLDMGLPDVGGDVVASKILKEKLNLQIILVTADEKTTKRVSKTISTGVTAFIQKPFTIDELKKALDIAESEYLL